MSRPKSRAKCRGCWTDPDSLRAAEPELRLCLIFPGRVATDMQRELRRQEGGAYEADRYLQPETLAGVVLSILSLPEDAVIEDLVIRPRG